MSEPITCEACGKLKGEGEMGKHWICEDCRVDEQTQAKEMEIKKPQSRGNYLTGTLICVLGVGAIIIGLWFGVFFLFLSRHA